MPKGTGRPYDKFTRKSVRGASGFEARKNQARKTGERSKMLNKINPRSSTSPYVLSGDSTKLRAPNHPATLPGKKRKK